MVFHISCRSFAGRCGRPFPQGDFSQLRPVCGLSYSQYCKMSALNCADKTSCAAFTDTFLELMTAVCRQAIGFGFCSESSHALSLPFCFTPYFLCRLSFGFKFCRRDFLCRQRQVELPDEVVVNVCLLLPVRLFAHGFVNDDFINQLTSHFCGQFRRLFVLLDELDKASDPHRGNRRFLQPCFNLDCTASQCRLFIGILPHKRLILLLGQ